ncbi:hypothetical protein AX15_003723 [Amanita polypyramis BW_CC]|nr:hypothetical protein AX15_003723 [Amanita polypyramis BW_CC]
MNNRDENKNKSRSRWDKRPGEYAPQLVKSQERTSGEKNGGTQAHENVDEQEHHGKHRYDDGAYRRHDRSRHDYHEKEYGKDNKNVDNPRRGTGYMRAWDDEDSRHNERLSKGERYDRNGHGGGEDGYKDYRGNYSDLRCHDGCSDNADLRKYQKESRPKNGSRRGERTEASMSGSRSDRRANEIGEEYKPGRRSCHVSRLGEDVRESHDYYGSRKYGYDAERRHQRREYHDDSSYDHMEQGRANDVVDVQRGRKHTRSRSPTSRYSSPDKSSDSDSDSSIRSESASNTSRSRSRIKRTSERSPHGSSKRKHRRRSRSQSRSDSGSSSGERERKRKRKDKKRKDKSRKKDKEERRSILTGKKIKLKVKKERGDHERDVNRQELLQFLNAAYE